MRNEFGQDILGIVVCVALGFFIFGLMWPAPPPVYGFHEISVGDYFNVQKPTGLNLSVSFIGNYNYTSANFKYLGMDSNSTLIFQGDRSFGNNEQYYFPYTSGMNVTIQGYALDLIQVNPDFSITAYYLGRSG
jgi:hypothetical protein